MPAIFHRKDNSLVELLPTYPETLPMSGKYVLDYPDHFDIKATNGAFSSVNDIQAKISSAFKEKFVAFDYFITNDLLDSNSFSNNFILDTSVSVSILDNEFFPVGANNQQFTFNNSFKRGTLPNTLSVLGRFPKKNHIEGATITSQRSASGNNCIITQDIDIAGSTLDNLGRADYFVYFRSTLQSYVKDRSLSDTERNEPNPLTANRTGYMSYTNTQYDSPNRLRCFISSDGSTCQEVNNLTVFSFNGKVDTIRLAWVNYTDADLTLLSYTLIY